MEVLGFLERRSPWRFLAGVLGPGAATLVGIGLGSSRTTAPALVYLLAVMLVAAAAGVGPGILASVLSFLGLNFFFTPPRHTLSVGKTDDLIALVVFLSVGFVASTLVAVALSQRARAERRENETRSLYALSARLLSGEDLEGAFRDFAQMMRRLLRLSRCEVRIDALDGGPEVYAADGTAGDEGATLVLPLSVAERPVGTVTLVPPGPGLGEAERRVAGILARQASLVLERSALEREAREARLAAEASRVRQALLSAVSHDFRTPLAAVKAALTALAAPDAEAMSPAAAHELLGTALQESDRLERLVTNLLDLTRIRAGALAPDRVAVPVSELVEDVLAGLRGRLASHRIAVLLRPDIPPVWADAVQMGQVFRNVLENAVRFAPDGSELRISAARWQDSVEVRFGDRGPGIPLGEREAVFQEFYRSKDDRSGGSGLGLAIARAIVDAHAGTIWVEETPGGGTTVVVRIPAAEGNA